MKYYGGPEGLLASAAELYSREFPASGKLRSAERTNFSPTSNVSLQPRAPCSKNCWDRRILACPFERATAATISVKCTQTGARESTEYKVGSYLPTFGPAQLTPPTQAAHGLQHDTPPTGVCVLWVCTSGKYCTSFQTTTHIQWIALIF